MSEIAESIDLNELRTLAEAATPGPWERGDHWHIQGSDFCQCNERHGPLVEERQMNINGTMMDAHVHRSEKPWWEHGIYSEVRQGGFPVNVVNDTQEYGLMADADAEFIAATDPQTVLALIERAREAEKLAAVRRDTIATYERENADWSIRAHTAERRLARVERLRDLMEEARDDTDESVRLSTILVDLNAALDEGDKQ